MTTTVRHLLCILLFIIAAPVYAQAPTRVVYIEGSEKENDFEKQVASALSARISATARYVLGEAKAAEIEVNVVCLDLSKMTRSVSGGVCSYYFVFWPKPLGGLSCGLGPLHINSSGEPSKVGEEIFQDMVNASTEKVLVDKLETMRSAVAIAKATNR